MCKQRTQFYLSEFATASYHVIIILPIYIYLYMYTFIFKGLYPIKGVGILIIIINIKPKVKSIIQIFLLYSCNSTVVVSLSFLQRKRERKTSFVKFSNFMGKKLRCIYSAQMTISIPLYSYWERKRLSMNYQISKLLNIHLFINLCTCLLIHFIGSLPSWNLYSSWEDRQNQVHKTRLWQVS